MQEAEMVDLVSGIAFITSDFISIFLLSLHFTRLCYLVTLSIADTICGLHPMCQSREPNSKQVAH